MRKALQGDGQKKGERTLPKPTSANRPAETIHVSDDQLLNSAMPFSPLHIHMRQCFVSESQD
jgi:hypothetical protein